MLAEPGYRAKAQQARDLHENDRTLTWENIAKRVQLGTGATARRWVAALYDLEGQERGARKR